jgi:hypothetical protein
VSFCVSLSLHLDDFHGALVCTDTATLAIVIIDGWLVLFVEFNTCFRTIYPADLAARALFKVYDGSKRAP